MNKIKISKDEFFELSASEIAEITRQLDKPKVGIFVPDGNRRMTLAFGEVDPDSDEFYYENARMTTHHFLKNLKVFFNHGLQTLFVPLISSNVFHRNKKYQDITLKEGLFTILKNEDWLDFYDENDIRVHVYGQLAYFQNSAHSIIHEWIEDVKDHTLNNKSHHLFYGFLSPSRIGMELIRLGIDFYEKYGRDPTYSELVKKYYGEEISPANFFIMSTKLAGLGALPPLISGQETQMYFLVAPGVLSLTQDTYREILYDLLFCRPNNSTSKYIRNDVNDIESLKKYYLLHKSNVIGLGKRIGRFWIPNV